MENVYACYINLDRRVDRNQTVKNNLVNLGFRNENIKRFSAIDGKNLIEDLKKKNYDQDEIIDSIIESMKRLDKTLSIGEIGCMLSHYFLLKDIYNNSSISENSLIFIFEDDFFINQSYLQTKSFDTITNEIIDFDKNNNWDLIYLGGRFNQNFIPKPENFNFFNKINRNIFLRIKGQSWDWDRTTHSYVVKKKNIANIYNLILKNFQSNNLIEQIDSLYNNSTSKILTFDHFPHLFYSPMNWSSDIQHDKTRISFEQLKNLK